MEPLEARTYLTAAFDHVVDGISALNVPLQGVPAHYTVTDGHELQDGSILLVFKEARPDEGTTDPLCSGLIKFTPDGALDRRFGVDGVVSWTESARVVEDDYTLREAQDGMIYVADEVWESSVEADGWAPTQEVVRRFHENGRRDIGFGDHGLSRFGLKSVFSRPPNADVDNGTDRVHLADDGNLEFGFHRANLRASVTIKQDGTVATDATRVRSIPTTTTINGIPYEVRSAASLRDGREVWLADPIDQTGGPSMITVGGPDGFDPSVGSGRWFERPSTLWDFGAVEQSDGSILLMNDETTVRFDVHIGVEARFASSDLGTSGAQETSDACDQLEAAHDTFLNFICDYGIDAEADGLHDLTVANIDATQPTLFVDTVYSTVGAFRRRDAWLFNAMKPGRQPDEVEASDLYVLKRRDGAIVGFSEAPDNQSLDVFDTAAALPPARTASAATTTRSTASATDGDRAKTANVTARVQRSANVMLPLQAPWEIPSPRTATATKRIALSLFDLIDPSALG